MANSAATIYQQIIDKTEPQVQMVVESAKRSAAKHEMRFTDYDEEIVRLTATIKLIKSMYKYMQPTDRLISLDSRVSRGANVTITSIFERDGKHFKMNTEVIIAGGYNIQRAHYRYITKSELPSNARLAEPEEAKALRLQLKKMTKAEKVQVEIERCKNYIIFWEDTLTKKPELSDDEILEQSPDKQYIFPTIADLNEGSPLAEQVGDDVAKLEEWNNRQRSKIIESYNSDRKRAQTQIATFNKRIDKLEKKKANLLQS